MHDASTTRRVRSGVIVLTVAVIAAGALLRAGSPSVITRVWTGGGGTLFWGTAANWNPSGVPSGVERLVFPALSQSTNLSDLDNASYSFDLYLAESVQLSGNVIPSCLVTTQPLPGSPPPAARPGFIPGPIVDLGTPIRDNSYCPDGTVFYLATGTEIEFSGALRMLALKKQGPGTLYLEASGGGAIRQPHGNPAGANLSVTAGTLHVDAPLPTCDVTLQAGVLAGSGTIGAVTATGGTVSPEASPFDGGPEARARSVRRRVLVGSPAILSTGSVSFNSSTTVVLQLNGNSPGVSQDQLNVTGTVSLGNATLTTSFGSIPALGTVFVIIANDGTDPVVGTFTSLPEGATIPISGSIVGRISYVGGTGNDVTLTAITDVPVMPHAMLFVLGAIVLALGMRQLRSRAR